MKHVFFVVFYPSFKPSVGVDLEGQQMIGVHMYDMSFSISKSKDYLCSVSLGVY